MAIEHANLGQRFPNGNTLTDLCAVPPGQTFVFSSIVICNQSAERATFRLAHAPGGAADDEAHYLYYNTPLDGGESFPITLGLCARETDVIRVLSSNGQMSFNAYGERRS